MTSSQFLKENEMKKIAIYLAGSIKKEHEKADESFWTEDNMLLLRSSLQGYFVSFLNPAFRTGKNQSEPATWRSRESATLS